MVDLFTDGAFIGLPSASIDDDCTDWFPVFAACLAYCHERGVIAGDEQTVSDAVEATLEWLVIEDCVNP